MTKYQMAKRCLDRFQKGEPIDKIDSEYLHGNSDPDEFEDYDDEEYPDDGNYEEDTYF